MSFQQLQTYNNLFFPDAEILRPTWDHAFKAIFLDHPELTIKFINDFFEFSSPIRDLKFLSRELIPRGFQSKSVRLDVALKLADGTLIDLEMQTSMTPGYLRRCVFYNALLLATHTKKGAGHQNKGKRKGNLEKQNGARTTQLNGSDRPPSEPVQPNVISLTLLNDKIPQKNPRKFRHSYQLKDGDDYLDKDCFRIDVIELPKLRRVLDTLPPGQKTWMRLFLAQSYAEVRTLAKEEPLLGKVCEVLEMVSKSEKLRDRARMIWEGEFAVRNAEYLREKEWEKRSKELDERAEQLQKREEDTLKRELQVQKLEKKAQLRANRAKLRSDDAKKLGESVQKQAEDAQRQAAEALALATKALYAAGQKPEDIASHLKITTEMVQKILKST